MAEWYIHEDLRRKHVIQASSNRGFGLVFAAFFLIVALAPLRKHEPLREWAFVTGAAFLTVAILLPALLQPLNRLWTRLGFLLGRISTPAVMGLLFFLVFIPVAVLFRLFGKDPLRLTANDRDQSYWIERCPPGPMPKSMSNQF
jgi:hypothetical protein